MYFKNSIATIIIFSWILSAGVSEDKFNSTKMNKDYNLCSPSKIAIFEREVKLPKLIYIPWGANLDETLKSLEFQGIPLFDIKSYLKLPPFIKPGWIRIKKPISLLELFSKINTLPREKLRKGVMYNGDSLDEFLNRLSKQTNIPKKELLKEYFRYSPYIDGGILAGVYYIPYKIEARPLMAFFIERSNSIFKELAKEYLGSYSPKSFNRYLIIASIIQRETSVVKEMPYVSAVIYNRLKRGMKLQMDATLNYGPYSHKIVTPKRIREDSSRFNTYKYKGLPPTPLGSVSIDALISAFKPAKSDALFFVQGISSEHIFAKNYLEHLANITRIKAKRAKVRLYKRLHKNKIVKAKKRAKKRR